MNERVRRRIDRAARQSGLILVERVRHRSELTASRQRRPPRRSRRRCPLDGRKPSRTTGRRVANGGACTATRRSTRSKTGEHLEPECAGGRGAVPGGAGRRPRHPGGPVSRRDRIAFRHPSGTGRMRAPAASTTSRRCDLSDRRLGQHPAQRRGQRRRRAGIGRRSRECPACCTSRSSPPTTSRCRDSTPSGGCSTPP